MTANGVVFAGLRFIRKSWTVSSSHACIFNALLFLMQGQAHLVVPVQSQSKHFWLWPAISVNSRIGIWPVGFFLLAKGCQATLDERPASISHPQKCVGRVDTNGR
jgi:hypothetical protein